MNNILISNILDTDSYKFSHWKQYPPKTTAMFSYLESRGGKYSHTLFFGLQYYLKEYLSQKITMEQVEEAAQFAKAHGVPFNYEGWKYIATELDGKLPIRIKAIKEGSIIPTSNILVSVESTDPKCFWVVSWVETMLVRLWYPITVATQSWGIKNLIKSYLDKTADNGDAELPFKLHDFGSRGVSSRESAMIGGAAHLVSFLGTDTIVGAYGANKYYNSDMSGFSIPASEHSTMTMWGKDNEVDAFRNMLEQYADNPLVACVSDSYDIYNAVENLWGEKLKKEVEDFQGMLVVRPDSGDPPTVVCNVLQKLEEKFGATYNTKGYKVLNNVRVIQGDGVNHDSIKQILDEVEKIGFSASNVNFGMGGALLQKMNRDTQKFAFKCSWAKINGEDVRVFKDPVTDNGKKSKAGYLDLAQEPDGSVHTIQGRAQHSMLETVFEDGEILRDETLDEIRQRSNLGPFSQYKGWVDKAV